LAYYMLDAVEGVVEIDTHMDKKLLCYGKNVEP